MRLADTQANIAASLILNDDVDGAETELDKGISSFHNVRLLFPLVGGFLLIYLLYSWEKESLPLFVQH